MVSYIEQQDEQMLSYEELILELKQQNDQLQDRVKNLEQ